MFILTRPTEDRVVTLGVEEQSVEQRFGGLAGRRLARAHDTIDIKQRLFVTAALVGKQRIAHVAADIDVIDIEKLKFLVTGFLQASSIST